MPGGNPVTAAPGWIPMSPVTLVAPLLVIAGVPASIANDAAVPRPTGDGPAAFAVPLTMLIARTSPTHAESAKAVRRNGSFICALQSSRADGPRSAVAETGATLRTR